MRSMASSPIMVGSASSSKFNSHKDAVATTQGDKVAHFPCVTYINTFFLGDMLIQYFIFVSQLNNVYVHLTLDRRSLDPVSS